MGNEGCVTPGIPVGNEAHLYDNHRDVVPGGSGRNDSRVLVANLHYTIPQCICGFVIFGKDLRPLLRG